MATRKNNKGKAAAAGEPASSSATAPARVANAMPAGSVDLENPQGMDIEAEVTGGAPTPAEPPTKGPRGVVKNEPADAAGGDVAGEVTDADFMAGQAKKDRAAAKVEHVDEGLKAAATMVDRMRKGLAYAQLLHDFDVKLGVLQEIADTAGAVHADAVRAVEAARAETRNVQR